MLLGLGTIVAAPVCLGEPAPFETGQLGGVPVRVPTDLVVSGLVYRDSEGGQTPPTADGVRDIAYLDFALDKSSFAPVPHHGRGERGDQQLIRDNYLVAIDLTGIPQDAAEMQQRHAMHLAHFLTHPLHPVSTSGVGLTGVGADRGARHYNEGFDEAYFDPVSGTELLCNNAHAKVAPFEDVSSCNEEFVVPGFRAGARVSITKSELLRWKDIRNGIIKTLKSFMVER